MPAPRYYMPSALLQSSGRIDEARLPIPSDEPIKRSQRRCTLRKLHRGVEADPK